MVSFRTTGGEFENQITNLNFWNAHKNRAFQRLKKPRNDGIHVDFITIYSGFMFAEHYI